MKELLKKRKKILRETVDFYRKYPRCIGFFEREDYKGDVIHHYRKVAYCGETLGLTSVGCAIGRLLPVVVAKEIDETLGEVGIRKAWRYFPDYIKELGEEFLIELSCLHDNDKWWFENDLSEEGKEFYKEIETKFCKL